MVDLTAFPTDFELPEAPVQQSELLTEFVGKITALQREVERLHAVEGFSTSPTFNGNITLDDGVGDSPMIRFIGGSNDDEAQIFLEDDAVAFNSDLVFRIPGPDADARAIFRSTTPADVAYIDGAGNADFLGHVAIGPDAAVDAQRTFNVVDSTLDTVDTYYGIYNDHLKSAGVTNGADDMYGIYSVFEMDQAGTIGTLWGAYIEARLDAGAVGSADGGVYGVHALVNLNAGTVSDDVWGLHGEIDMSGTDITGDVRGLDGWLDLNTGSVSGDIYGLMSWIDVAAGFDAPGDDVFGLYAWVDVNSAATGDVYMLYLDENDGIDYGVYQNGTSDNYFGGNVGIGTDAPAAAARVHVLEATAAARIYVESTNNGSNAGVQFYALDAGAGANFGGIFYIPVVGANNSYIGLSGDGINLQLNVKQNGVVTIANLAGAGNRNVIASAAGVLSAP